MSQPRRPSGRPVSPAIERDHQPSSSTGAAAGGDRLGFSGEALQRGVPRGTGQPPLPRDSDRWRPGAAADSDAADYNALRYELLQRESL